MSHIEISNRDGYCQKFQVIMTIQDLINPPVTTCTINTDIAGARDLMTLKKISALPVVETDGEQIKLRGIVSFFDLAGVYDDTINIQQVMTQDVQVIPLLTSVQEAASIMIEKRIHHLVVMDGERIAGIVSSLDFVKIVAESPEALSIF